LQHVKNTIKFEHPRILLVDLDLGACEALVKAGFNAVEGTFGKPYSVDKDAGYVPVIATPKLPDYTEQEIIIANIGAIEPANYPDGVKCTANSDLDWWSKANLGFVDPRPRAMIAVQDSFDRILRSGGLFVLFVGERISQEFVFACQNHNRLSIDSQIYQDNWSLLQTGPEFEVVADLGRQIRPGTEDMPIIQLISEHISGASFSCTLEPPRRFRENWIPLAHNKYGKTVAGALAPESDDGGWILLFPNLSDKPRFITKLVEEILPNLSPRLFPSAENQAWTHRPEYELATVLEKERQIMTLKAETATKIATLENDIKADREARKFLYTLLNGTGSELVAAVESALALLGFTDVVDVDAELKKAGNEGSLREDLRIHDESPVLVVDVKGVRGHPADSEALQAQKHAFIYTG
jgi:hypothetical protein